MAKWLDKYDTPKAQNGIEGTMGGLTDKGFNYNGAWGGPSMQMGGTLQPPMAGAVQTLPMYQMGGYVYPTTFVPEAQNGYWSKNKKAYVDSVLTANKNLDWVKRLYDKAPNAVMVPGESHPSTHLISDNDQGYVFPQIVNMNGQLVDLGNRAEDYARETNTGIQLPKEQGTWFARSTSDKSGYKMGTGVMKGKPVMQKYKKQEMGGNVPGSVGFTYARTQGIPSEGPYAKKTIPSAQKGKKIDIRRVPKRTDSDAENLFEILDPTGLSSWDDIYRSYKKTGWSPETALEVLGAIPLLGNIAKVTKPGIHLAKYSKVDKALFNTLPRNKSLSSTVSGASKVGRGTDTYQAYDEYQNGGEMQFYQNGLDWTPRNISKNGSVVKDNNGYWNPDNWGKVVEIDSPNITMKGVNQDLIGVSDEGDIQYMTPGNDYTFDGNRVTEYPVAKYGVNQQDEKTVQHLDQLLNFTNKPKAKNGWLDKYK